MRLFSEHSTRKHTDVYQPSKERQVEKKRVTRGKSVVGYNRSQVRVLGDDWTCQMMLCAQVKSECC